MEELSIKKKRMSVTSANLFRSGAGLNFKSQSGETLINSNLLKLDNDYLTNSKNLAISIFNEYFKTGAPNEIMLDNSTKKEIL